MHNSNYLFVSHHRAALVYVPPCTSGEDWGKISRAWETKYGAEFGFLSYPVGGNIRNNVIVHEYLYSAEGMGYTLIPLPTATDEDLKTLRSKLKNEHDVAHMGTVRVRRWTTFQREINQILGLPIDKIVEFDEEEWEVIAHRLEVPEIIVSSLSHDKLITGRFSPGDVMAICGLLQEIGGKHVDLERPLAAAIIRDCCLNSNYLWDLDVAIMEGGMTEEQVIAMHCAAGRVERKTGFPVRTNSTQYSNV